MDDLMGIFSPKPFKSIPFELPSARRCYPEGMTGLDSYLNEVRSSVATTSGTEYAEEYIREEEKRVLAERDPYAEINGKPGNNYEGVSLVTSAPVHPDQNNEELMQIYNTYSFDRNPRENLSIMQVESKIISMVGTNAVTVIVGPTGCGKTTQVPQFILDSCYKKRVYCNIIVTQPRRIAAISIAKRVSQERKWPVGSLVGYQVGMVNNTSQDTRLNYCTTGVLLHKLIASKNMNDYTHVIIDEVHERDQEMDFLLLVVRKLQRSNSRRVKVILMSATFDTEKFANYFSIPVGNKLVSAPIVDIAKSNFFMVQIHYLCRINTLGPLPEVSADEPKVTRPMMEFCRRILYVLDDVDRGEDRRHAVLVFLPGIWEIEQMDNLIGEKSEQYKWDVVVLHSSITNEEQQRVFEQPPTGYRRIILATNIAESSITVPDIKFVIDFCLTKQLVTDPRTNFQCLELGWASRASCEQRAGRTGRLMDGRVYRLVPQRFYDTVLMDEGIPEMLRAPLENVVLKAKMLDMGEPKALLALSLDPPDLSNLERTILLLKETGALLDKEGDEISQFDGNLTDLGRIMAHLPVDIHIAKLIALGNVFSVLREAIIIGASMATKNMFSAPFRQELKAFTVKLAWADSSNSDCIAFLNVYNMWMQQKAKNVRNDQAEKRWATRQFLQIKVLREIDALIYDLEARLRRLGIDETVGPSKVIWKDDERPLVLKIVIAGAFYPNYYARCLSIDQSDAVKVIAGHDPTTTVYLQGWPVNQPGPLYARSIQEHFRDCVSSENAKILVMFDNSSKIYVQFRANESPDGENFQYADEPGEISLSVYKAVKLRQVSNEPIEIPLLPAEQAQEKAEELGIQHNTCQHLIRKDGPDDEIPQQDFGLRPVLPALDTSYIPLIIRRVVTPGHFWAQVRDEENATRLRTVQSLLNTVHPSNFPELREKPEIGSLVIAPRENAQKPIYCRAIVQSVSIGTKTELLAKILFIDYGYVDRVRVCDLRQVGNHVVLERIPALVMECVLAEVRPASMVNDAPDRWSPKALEEFHKLLKGDEISIFGEVFSVVNSIVAVKLIRVDGTDQLELNQHLVDLGYAERKVESYMSRCNHELRKYCISMPLRQRQHHEELQYERGFVSDRYPEPPAVEDYSAKATLRGPFSPLEVQLAALAKAGMEKRVQITSSSVNSVLLDSNPDDPHDRLVIAGSVSQNNSGFGLNLRNTTLMPNIPGLTSLLCLMFTPQIELRRNYAGTRYTGALCGLGYHPTTKTSLFPEHDLSVYFDVDITMDDLQDVNRLRHWMSMGIYVNPFEDIADEGIEQLRFCQNRVRDVLLALLEKRRSPITRELDSNFDRWCRYDESQFIRPGKVVTANAPIFRLHSALDLNERNDDKELMVAHIIELRELSTRHYRDQAVAEVQCRLCNVSIGGVFQLRIHLHTEEHKEKESKYHPLPSNR